MQQKEWSVSPSVSVLPGFTKAVEGYDTENGTDILLAQGISSNV